MYTLYICLPMYLVYPRWCICRVCSLPGTLVGIPPCVYVPVYLPGYTSVTPSTAAVHLPGTLWGTPYRANPRCYRTNSCWHASYRYPFHCWLMLCPSPVSLLVKKGGI